jgi:hypothetical protein
MCDNNATVSLAKLPPGGTTETLNLFIFRWVLRLLLMTTSWSSYM